MHTVSIHKLARQHSPPRSELSGFRWTVWLPLAVTPTLAWLLAPADMPRWVLMWLVCATIYSSFKWISWKIARRPEASWFRKLAWWLGWPGMDVARFLSAPANPASLRPSAVEWTWAVSKTLFGAALFVVGGVLRDGYFYVGGWCGMFGMVLMLHFGVFHLLSCGWRLAGIDAPPIMDRPLRSQSLGEFWGRRWNRAFRDVAHTALFRPVGRRWGSRAAMWAVFLFSGIIHEAGISGPAGAGFGLPTLYFLLQAAAMMFQNSETGRRLSFNRGRTGQAFTLLVVFGPVAMLFHSAFVYRVVVPLMQAVVPG